MSSKTDIDRIEDIKIFVIEFYGAFHIKKFIFVNCPLEKIL